MYILFWRSFLWILLSTRNSKSYFDLKMIYRKLKRLIRHIAWKTYFNSIPMKWVFKFNEKVCLHVRMYITVKNYSPNHNLSLHQILFSFVFVTHLLMRMQIGFWWPLNRIGFPYTFFLRTPWMGLSGLWNMPNIGLCPFTTCLWTRHGFSRLCPNPTQIRK